MMISDDAVEAAAKAFIEHGTLLEALEAAAPHMLADVWDQGELAGKQNYGLFLRPITNPYRSQA